MNSRRILHTATLLTDGRIFGLAPGSAIAVRLTYLGRPGNAVTIGVQ